MPFASYPSEDLNGRWMLAYSDVSPQEPLRTIADVENAGMPRVPATVPGNFELDLHAAGTIPEPFFGMNIADLRRFEKTHVWYCRRFSAAPPPDHQAVLVFEGLDCFADIYLNGQRIGSGDNMLVEQVFPVGAALQTENELVVHIRPALEEARQYDYPPGLLAEKSGYEALYVRKAPHMYGWDIMPRALSAGMWRPVALRYLPAERLETVYLQTFAADEYQARLVLRFQAHLADLLETHYEIEIEGRCGESQFARRERILFEAGRIVFNVADPQRWWPRGRGPAALYDVTVRLYRDGQEIDRRAFRHGIRTIELRRTSITDSFGNGEFCFVVNGEKLFVRGTNWVPADAYHSRDAERIPRMLALAEELDCNMIRCWGGNVYENDLFYDLCDEKGILIWQDFAMACALYPQDDAFCARLAEEAQKVVRRLRQHACLALWAGDNECDDAYLWSGLGDPDSNRLTRESLPRALQAEDPIRPYLPSSPYTDAEAQRAGAEFRSENHLWGPRDYFRSDFYRNALCHFASEIGYHGCPAPSSLRRFLSPDKLWPPQNEEWLLHSTSPVPGVDIYDYRVALVCNQVREMFGSVPETLEDFARLSQYVQAEAFKFFIEMFRTAKWRRTGLLWWNLIDGWPQISDAVVDYYFEKKLAFDYIQAVQAPLCLMLREPKAWRQELVACNDTREDISLTYRLYESGAAQALAAGNRMARGDSVTPLASIPHFAGDKRFYIIEWESERGSGVNHYLAGSPPFDAEQYRSWLDSLRAVRSRKETERLK